jgi:predicted ATP-grasp superfamily ATP-dependent carboligase
VLAALRTPGLEGWIAGSGFEGRAELLEEAAQLLPLLGTAPAAVRRVRDAADFFAALAALQLPHPETRFEPPADLAGWLRKDFGGAGGWHVHRAANAPAARTGGSYWQRELRGQPIGVLFVADGQRAQVIGVHAQQVQPLPRHPYLYAGAIGPLPLAETLRQEIDAAVQALAAAFALRGLCSLDGLLDGERLAWLEINPRPPASVALYRTQPGLLALHVAACAGRLPTSHHRDAATRGEGPLYAEQACAADAATLQAWQALGHVHDLPTAPTRWHAGEPVCSVSAEGDGVDAVAAGLAHRRRAVRATLRPC